MTNLDNNRTERDYADAWPLPKTRHLAFAAAGVFSLHLAPTVTHMFDTRYHDWLQKGYYDYRAYVSARWLYHADFFRIRDLLGASEDAIAAEAGQPEACAQRGARFSPVL